MDFAQQRLKLQQLLKERQQGDEGAAQAQRAQGRLTARERVGKLLDPASFVEMDAFSEGGGAVCGYGLVNSRPVFVIAQDATQGQGAMSQAQARKMLKTLALAEKSEAPVVLFPDSAGAMVQEGAPMLAAYAGVFARLAQLSGICPIIAVLSGSAVGIASQFAALADIAIAVDKACQVMPFAPGVMNAVTGAEEAKDAGGAKALTEKGMAALRAADEDEGIQKARALVDLLPSSGYALSIVTDGEDLNRLVSVPAQSVDALAGDLCDTGTALELYHDWRPGCRTWLARVGGYAVGLVACDSQVDGGRLDAFACDKVAKLVRLCDAFALPVVTLVDSQGLQVPGINGQAWLMTASARMLSAYAQAEVPKVAVITGNAVGAAYVSFSGEAMADITYAWPTAYVAPLTAQAAAQTFHAEEMADKGKDVVIDEAAQGADAFAAAAAGLVDQVIDPQDTRKHLIAALEMLAAQP